MIIWQTLSGARNVLTAQKFTNILIVIVAGEPTVNIFNDSPGFFFVQWIKYFAECGFFSDNAGVHFLPMTVILATCKTE